MTRISVVALALLLISIPTVALEPEEDAVFIRVIDVGSGLACVIQMPGPRYMIYDAGHWAGGGATAFEGIAEIIPEDSEIELLVLSHSDSDHLAAADEICDAYTVKRVLRTGLRRTTSTWGAANEAIRQEKENEDCIDINLSYFEYPSGATYRFGEVFVTMVYGLGRVPNWWIEEYGLSLSEQRNAVSIVMRLQYDGKSVLFAGDTVGRHIGDQASVCIAAEKEMVRNAEAITLDSDVIIAPHHGADNGSSTAFIEAVSPSHVIFSAGHAHEHPRKDTADRYLAHGVALENIFRTDRGDNEGDDEWDNEGTAEADSPGDDDVDILLRKDPEADEKAIEVAYRH